MEAYNRRPNGEQMTKAQIIVLLALMVAILILAGPQDTSGFLLDGQILR